MTTATTPGDSALAFDEGYPAIINMTLVNNRAFTVIHWVRTEVPASIYAPQKRIAFCGFEVNSSTPIHVAIKDESELPAGTSVCAECALYR